MIRKKIVIVESKMGGKKLYTVFVNDLVQAIIKEPLVPKIEEEGLRVGLYIEDYVTQVTGKEYFVGNIWFDYKVDKNAKTK